MDIVFDFTSIVELFNLPPLLMVWRIFLLAGWIPVAMVFLYGVFLIWGNYISDQWGDEQKHILLAIDVPRINQQSPRAVENLITYLAGGHSTLNLIEEHWIGVYQLAFTLEIVSIEGYIQFLIHTPEKFRDLVESAVYSQYPDAEITEVEDYTEGMPDKFPDEEYDIWGSEFILKRPSPYPIKTYRDFIDEVPGKPEVQFKDPMSSLMSLMGGLGKGEQLWYQVIVRPIDMFKWTAEGEKEIDKILGETIAPEKNLADKVIDKTLGWLGDFSEFVYKLWGDIEDKEEKKDEALKMFNLKPREKKQIEAIQQKVAKVGFDTKVRMVYIAKKDVMNKPKVVNGFVGFTKQFVDIDLNNLKPDMDVTATSVSYLFVDYRLNRRKNNVVGGYKGRSMTRGRVPGVLNTEEIATIWHFPIEEVAPAPMLQKTTGRKVEPPMGLPTEEEGRNAVEADLMFDGGQSVLPDWEKEQAPVEKSEKPKSADPKGAPPANLPFA